MESTERVSGVPLTFKSLAKGDIDRLAPALKKAGMVIAYPHLSEPIVAELQDGTIVGFGFAQLLPHCEPLWVDPKWRGIGIAEALAARVVRKIEDTGAKRFCCIAENPFAENLCRQMGMLEVKGKLFVKDGG